MLDKSRTIRRASLIGLALSTLLLGACSSTLVVKGDIPTPLVERVPVNGALRYTDEFRNYVYNETRKKRALKSIDFNQAQIAMFDRIFGSLMTVVPIDDPSRDLVIEPEILDVQYTAPSETLLNQYEIWIKYRFKLTDLAGEKIADWVIKGYGKTPTATLSSATSGFNAAANVALRDVGAQLAIGFPRQSKIKALVNGGMVAAGSESESVSEFESESGSESGSGSEFESEEAVTEISDDKSTDELSEEETE